MALNTIPNPGLTKRGFPTARVANPLIINGGFEVSQRVGTTATSFVNNTYGLDRWKHYLAGSCALNYQQLGQASSIVTNLQSTSGINYTNCLYLDCTTAASLGATDQLSVLQLMEGYVHNPLAGKVMTLSFWVRSNVTGTYCIAFKEGSTKTYVVEYTISSADTWEQKILTLTDDTLANYNTNTSVTTGSSLEVHFTTRLGTTAQQTTADAWNTGNFYGTSNQVTWGTSTSDVFYLAAVQLEVGEFNSTTLPAFAFESFGANLARCQRYLEFSSDYGATYTSGVNSCVIMDMTSGSHPLYFPISYNTYKRAAPTMTFYNGNDGATGTWRTNASTDVSISGTSISSQGFTTNSSDLGGDGRSSNGTWKAESEL